MIFLLDFFIIIALAYTTICMSAAVSTNKLLDKTADWFNDNFNEYTSVKPLPPIPASVKVWDVYDNPENEVPMAMLVKDFSWDEFIRLSKWDELYSDWVERVQKIQKRNN